MELWEEILLQILKSNSRRLKSRNIQKIIQSESYKALKKIKQIVSDNSLTDKECFLQIEEIICVLEDVGSNGGNRHDY